MVVNSFEIDENGNPVEVLRDLEDLELFGVIPEYEEEELRGSKFDQAIDQAIEEGSKNE